MHYDCHPMKYITKVHNKITITDTMHYDCHPERSEGYNLFANKYKQLKQRRNLNNDRF